MLDLEQVSKEIWRWNDLRYLQVDAEVLKSMYTVVLLSVAGGQASSGEESGS